MIPFPLRLKLEFELRQFRRNFAIAWRLTGFPGRIWVRTLWPLAISRLAHMSVVTVGLIAAILQSLRFQAVAILQSRPLVAIALIEHFGDIVASEPLIGEVRARHPTSRIVWVLKRPYRSLLRHHPELSGTIVVPCLTTWLVLRKLVSFTAVYDCHLRLRACPRCAIATSGNPLWPDLNQSTYYHHGCLLDVFGETSGLGRIEQTPTIYLPRRSHERAAQLIPERPFAVLHRHSNELARDWNDDSWIALSQWLRRRCELEVVEVGASNRHPSERETSWLSLSGRLTLPETAAVIAQARLFIGVDSGPAHFANAGRVPSVILLGRYLDFATRIPYSGWLADPENASLLQWDGPCREIPVQLVKRAVSKHLGLREELGQEY